MKKRGVSPLIASIFLVGITVVVSVIIFGWGNTLLYSMQEDQELDLVKLGMVDFDAKYRDVGCSVDSGSFCYSLLLINNEDFDLNFLVRTKSDLGVDVDGPFVVGAYEQKIFNISFLDSMGRDVYAEVDAYV